MKHIRCTCLTLAGTTFLAAPLAPLFAQDTPDQPLEFGAPPDSGTEDQPMFNFGEGEDQNGLDFGDLKPLEEEGAKQPPAVATTGPQSGEMELLTLNGAPIEQVMLLLQRLSGRPVQPDSLVLSQQAKLTIINSTPLTRTQALNLLVDTLFANRIGVIDRGSHLAVVNIANIQEGMVPVLGPEVDVLSREDTGMIYEKVFQIKYGKASTIKDKVQAQGPPNMKIEVEDASNQIIALYNIGTLKRVQEQIDNLDISASNLQLETFYLRYADAERVAKLIVGIFGESQDPQQGNRQNQGGIFGPRNPRQQSDQGLQTSTQLSVVTDKALNSVTVRAERDIIEQVKSQIKESWDVQIPVSVASPMVVPLINSDAVKMAEMLNKIFAQEGEVVQQIESDFFGNLGGARQQSQQSRNTEGEGPKLAPLAGQVSFIADATKNSLIVTSRSPEYYPMIKKFIETLDTPGDANVPKLYELRYADAEDLANRLNALLADAGSRVDVNRTNQELTQRSNVAQVGNQDTNQQQQQQQQEAMQFPWQSGSPDPNARKISNLIGQVRIMPIARQNALLVMAPPELRESMAKLVDTLDAPGRQVLIQAIIAEVSADDATSLGIRWGSGNVATGPNEDNRIVVGSSIEGTKNELINALFDTSTLGVNVDLNVALQALAQVTDVNVLFRPKVVTSDNEEANFFDGQDIPFITDSTTTDVGGVTQSFEYLAVGIQLNVRPHITVEGNIDLRVNLQLSSVVPGQTLFGGSILDRRETTTKVTIRDGQTVVISGIRRTELSDIVRKVPLLGDIPLIGGLFRSTEKSESRTELVAFIRPIILDSPEKLRSSGLDDYKLLNESRKRLEGADVDQNPASLEHWNEPLYREKYENDLKKLNDDGNSRLPWMQEPRDGAVKAEPTQGNAKVTKVNPAVPDAPLAWQQYSKD